MEIKDFELWSTNRPSSKISFVHVGDGYQPSRTTPNTDVSPKPDSVSGIVFLILFGQACRIDDCSQTWPTRESHGTIG